MKKAITLSILVISIIVMIIISGTIIISLSNTDIIDKTGDAKQKYNEIEVQNMAMSKWTKAYSKGVRSAQELENYVMTQLQQEGIDTNLFAIEVTENGVTVLQSVIDIVDTVPIPKGFVASKATGENTKAGGLVIYEGTEDVTDANVEIAKRIRNQYVWIPVEEFDEFVRQDFAQTGITISNEIGLDVWEVEIDEATNTPKDKQSNMEYITRNTIKETQAMYKSVQKYKGFYIARYEAGTDVIRNGTNKEQAHSIYSVMGKYPYNWVRWSKTSYTDKGGAIELARSIYPSHNKAYGVVSTLSYAVQWDAMAAWVLQSYPDGVYGQYKDSAITSKDEFNEGAKVAVNSLIVYTNYEELTYPRTTDANWRMTTTGALKNAKANNLYDISGNIAEITMETKAKTLLVYDRGNMYTLSQTKAFTDRGQRIKTTCLVIRGFRPALYIK